MNRGKSWSYGSWIYDFLYADEEDNPVNNTNIYNVEGDNSTLAMQILWLQYQSR
jgi:hypothetical protein